MQQDPSLSDTQKLLLCPGPSLSVWNPQVRRTPLLLNNNFPLQYHWGYARLENTNLKENLPADRAECSSPLSGM